MWFLMISAVIFTLYAIFMPKKLKPIEMFAAIFFAATLQDNVDIYLGLKYDLYGYFAKGAQWKTLIVILGIYPAITVIFLNYYPSFRSVVFKSGYIIVWSGFALLYEYAAVKSGYFYYNGWKYWYSAISYPILFVILVVVLKIIRKLIAKSVHPG